MIELGIRSAKERKKGWARCNFRCGAICFGFGAGMAGSHLKFGKNEGPDESITEKCSGPPNVHN